MIYSFEDPKIIDSLFFLFLGTIGAYIGTTITSCKLKTLLQTNKYFRHIFFFIIIYFTNSYIQNGNIKDTLTNSLILYVMFILLMRNDYRVLISVILLLVIHKLIDQHIRELTNQNESNEKIQKYKDANKIIIKLSILVMLLGFIYYMYKKKQKFGTRFSIQEYMFNNKGCK